MTLISSVMMLPMYWRRCGGSIPDFVALMDQKVKELGLSNTHLSNPSGLDVEDGYPEHQTTARDLAQIMRYATSNHIFRRSSERPNIPCQLPISIPKSGAAGRAPTCY